MTGLTVFLTESLATVELTDKPVMFHALLIKKKSNLTAYS